MSDNWRANMFMGLLLTFACTLALAVSSLPWPSALIAALLGGWWALALACEGIRREADAIRHELARRGINVEEAS